MGNGKDIIATGGDGIQILPNCVDYRVICLEKLIFQPSHGPGLVLKPRTILFHQGSYSGVYLISCNLHVKSFFLLGSQDEGSICIPSCAAESKLSTCLTVYEKWNGTRGKTRTRIRTTKCRDCWKSRC